METERPARRPNAAAIIAEYNPFHLGHATRSGKPAGFPGQTI